MPINLTNLIYCEASYGPTFGGKKKVNKFINPDLFISDACQNNQSSYANVPNYYNKEGENKYQNDQKMKILFCGSPNGYFRVVEYEVFRVIY